MDRLAGQGESMCGQIRGQEESICGQIRGERDKRRERTTVCLYPERAESTSMTDHHRAADEQAKWLRQNRDVSIAPRQPSHAIRQRNC